MVRQSLKHNHHEEKASLQKLQRWTRRCCKDIGKVELRWLHNPSFSLAVDQQNDSVERETLISRGVEQ
jgi:hypothetical protein